jgi:hypothetical protein
MTGMKRHLIILIALIAVLDTAAALVFYHLHLDRDPGTRQQIYVGIWTLTSAVIVAVQLRKIRQERVAAIRASPAIPVKPPDPGSKPDEDADSGTSSS